MHLGQGPLPCSLSLLLLEQVREELLLKQAVGGASVGAAGIDAAGSGVAAVTGTPPGEIEIVETAAAAALGTGAGDATTAPRETGGNLGSTPFANALQMFPDTGAGGGLRGPPRRKSSFQPSSTAKSCTSASEISRGKRASK